MIEERSEKPTVRLPVLPSDVRAPEDRFRCVPYQAILLAGACAKRQAAARGDLPAKGDARQGWGRGVGDYAKCNVCPIGRQVTVGLGRTTPAPASSPTQAHARKTAGDIIADLSDGNLLGLVEDICKRLHVRIEDALGRGRQKSIAAARHAIWAHFRWALRWSYLEMGRLFGVDHSTVMSALGSTKEARVAAQVAFLEALPRPCPAVMARCLPEAAERCA